MKVHLIKRTTIEDFISSNLQSALPLADWLMKLKYADWKKPNDIKKTFRSADLLGNGTNRVVFDIAGNHYRLICKYVFGERQVHLFVCWIGTHAAYTTLCKLQKQYYVNDY
jgi:mRNA interferase HigB